MKRLTLHLIFGAAALTTGLLAGWQALHLQQAGRVNAARDGGAADTAGAALPEARFAGALALARTAVADGQVEAATAAWKSLVDGDRSDLRQAALYNLGNLHMREALAQGAAEALPLIELAKQRYRDALRARPDDWHARYNLERALWLAPEVEHHAAADDDGEDPPKERVVTTLQGVRLDLP
jgi:mxaK protein